MGIRSWLLKKLSGGEPTWIVLTETTPARATWIAQRLEHDGIETQQRNGDEPTSARRRLGTERPRVVWVAVQEPDIDTARRLIGSLTDDGPAGLVTPAKFTQQTRRYLERHRRSSRPLNAAHPL